MDLRDRQLDSRGIKDFLTIGTKGIGEESNCFLQTIDKKNILYRSDKVVTYQSFCRCLTVFVDEFYILYA